jgi:hypothetical protein
MTNLFNCGLVWDIYDQDPTADLAFDYYDEVHETVDQLLALGGYRIAALLNVVVEGYNADGTCV